MATPRRPSAEFMVGASRNLCLYPNVYLTNATNTTEIIGDFRVHTTDGAVV